MNRRIKDYFKLLKQNQCYKNDINNFVKFNKDNNLSLNGNRNIKLRISI